MIKPPALTISAKIFWGFSLLLFAFVGSDLWSVSQMRNIGGQLRMLKKYQRLTTLTSQLEALKLSKQGELIRLNASPPTEWSEELFQRLKFPPVILQKLSEQHQLLKQFPRTITTQEQAFLRKLGQNIAKLRERLKLYQRQLATLFAARQASQDSILGALLGEFRQIERALGREIRQLNVQMDLRLTQAVLSAEREERRSLWGLLGLTVAAFVMGIIILAVTLVPLRRIRDLVQDIKRIGSGNYEVRAKIPSGDELGVLAEEFNKMAQSLQERDHRLAQKRQELEDAYNDLQVSSEKLLHSERLAAIGRLAAQITHEVRNPLNAIGLNLELLEEDLETLQNPEEPLAVLQAAMEEVDRLNQITKEYLQFARLPPPQLESYNMNELLQNLITFLDGEFHQRQLEYEIHLAPSPPQVNIDHRQLRQALLNLLRNAMEAASAISEQGRITVRTTTQNQGVEIQILDNGTGIPSEQQDKIFDPFYTTKEEGSGLGLPLTQQIITSHGGQITCESEEDRGTRFIIFLPRAKETRRDEPTRPNPAESIL